MGVPRVGAMTYAGERTSKVIARSSRERRASAQRKEAVARRVHQPLQQTPPAERPEVVHKRSGSPMRTAVCTWWR
ncbi:MAG: hypothetical protein AB1762_11695 [Gemmatimonadota bacterium]